MVGNANHLEEKKESSIEEEEDEDGIPYSVSASSSSSADSQRSSWVSLSSPRFSDVRRATNERHYLLRRSEDSDSKETARDLLRKKIQNKRRNGRGEEDDVIAEVVRSVSNGINERLTIRLKTIGQLMASGDYNKLWELYQVIENPTEIQNIYSRKFTAC